MAKTRPSLKSSDPEGFLRAFTDEWADVQKEHRVVVDFVIEPTQRKGVLRLAMTAHDASEGRTGLSKAHYQCEYPTAAVQSFEACLFRCVVQLERVLRANRQWPMGKA